MIGGDRDQILREIYPYISLYILKSILCRLTSSPIGYTMCILIKNLEGHMIKKLVSHGNSAALIIDKPILDLLNVDMDTPLEVTTDGKNLIISPIETATKRKKFKFALDKVNRLHGKTLRRLAE